MRNDCSIAVKGGSGAAEGRKVKTGVIPRFSTVFANSFSEILWA